MLYNKIVGAFLGKYAQKSNYQGKDVKMGNNKSKNGILRKISSIAVALSTAACLVVSCGGGAYANTDYDSKIKELEQKSEQIKKDNEKRQSEIYNINSDVEDNEEKIALIEQQIDGINDELKTYGELVTLQMQKVADMENEIIVLEGQISNKEQEIRQKQYAIADLEQQNKEHLQKFAKLIRALYMNDASNTLPLLEGSDNWYNFFTYVDVVQNISEQNLEFMNKLLDDIHHQEDLIKGLEDDIIGLNSDRESLLTKKDAMEKELSDLEAKKAEIQTTADERKAALDNLSYNNESLKWKASLLESQIDASNEEVEEINETIKELIRAKQAENSGGTVYSSDGFRWPLDSNLQLITTYFGYDAWRGGNHYGIDVGNAGIGGKNIYAAQGGTVITAYNDGDWHGGFGNYVIIDHGGGLSTVYAHCSSTTVYVGQQVNKGDVIGYVGTTGWSTGNHLHFETRVNGTAVNPFGYTYEYV